MSFGVQIFSNTGSNVTSINKPLFVVDMVRPTSNGSWTYPLDANSEGLEVVAIRDGLTGSHYITNYSVVGPTVNWAVGSTSAYSNGPNVLLIMKYKRG